MKSDETTKNAQNLTTTPQTNDTETRVETSDDENLVVETSAAGKLFFPCILLSLTLGVV